MIEILRVNGTDTAYDADNTMVARAPRVYRQGSAEWIGWAIKDAHGRHLELIALTEGASEAQQALRLHAEDLLSG